MIDSVRVAVVGIGNCASSLIQGLAFYRRTGETKGLITPLIGSLSVADIEIVAAFDVDARKVGRTLWQAILSNPNTSRVFEQRGRDSAVRVQMAPVLDGVAAHLDEFDVEQRISVSDEPPADVVETLRRTRAEVVVCYLPVGSTNAARFVADCCLEAGVALINCIPVFIASGSDYRERYRKAKIPLFGDDIRSQVGATIVHQRLMELLRERGYSPRNTYQLNFGGNSDFLNMLARDRLQSKKISKTQAVRSHMGMPEADPDVHIGPSDYVPYLRDTKIAYIRAEALGFAGAELSMELRLQVEDSPNSAAVVVDVIRYAALAFRNKEPAIADVVSSYYMKSPACRVVDSEAKVRLASIAGVEERERDARRP